MSGGAGTAAAGQWPAGLEPVPNPNDFLSRPSIVWCWEIFLLSTFPIDFPYDPEAPPLRICVGDEYPPGVLGGKLYEQRILGPISIKSSAPDAYGGIQAPEGVRFPVAALDKYSVNYPDLHQWVQWEHGGKRALGHAYDRNTKEVLANAFKGEVLVLTDDQARVWFNLRALDPLTLANPVPGTEITPANAPFAPAESFGAMVGGKSPRMLPKGCGIGRNLPAYPVKVRNDTSSLTEKVFTADASTDTLTITGHGFDQEDPSLGPFRLLTTGTLPGGLDGEHDYWLLVLDEDTLQLCLSQGIARDLADTSKDPEPESVVVDILDAGTGTHTLSGGTAANLVEEYDYAAGTGNIGIVRVWDGQQAHGAGNSGLQTIADQQVMPATFTVAHDAHETNGRRSTVIRFRDPDNLPNKGTGPIIFDGQRVYPDVDPPRIFDLKLLRGFQDEIAGRDAFSALGILTTGNLVRSQTRWALGGLLLDGSDFLYVPDPVAFAVDQFTLEFEWTPLQRSSLGIRDLIQGPRSSDLRGYQLQHDEANQKLIGQVAFADLSIFTIDTGNGSVPVQLLHRVVLRRSGDKIGVFLGRTLLQEETHASPILYDSGAGAATMLSLGGWAGGNPARGRLGYVTFSVCGRSQREIDRAYFFMKRNPLEPLRDFCADAGVPINNASWTATQDVLDKVESGGLHWDGYVTEKVTLGAILRAAIIFRGLLFAFDEDGRLTVDADVPPTEIVGQCGVGDQYANIIDTPTRTPASLAEKMQRVKLLFRQNRDRTSGAVGGYAREVTRPVFAVGDPEREIPLPFVDDPVTADILCDRLAKQLVTEQLRYDFSLGHEARNWKLRDIVRFRDPGMSVPVVDLKILQIAKGDSQHSLSAVPISIGDFTYTPKRLPPDPLPPVITRLDLGPASQIELAEPQSRQISARVFPSVTDLLLPVANGLAQGMTLSGGGTHWEAVRTDDDDTTYISGYNGAADSFRYQPLPRVLRRIQSVNLHLRARLASGFSGLVNPTFALTGLRFGTRTIAGDGAAITDSSFADIITPPTPLTASPFTGQAWTSAEINALEAGPWSRGELVDFTYCALEVTQLQEVTSLFGYIRWWFRGPTDPDEQPPTPGESADSAPSDQFAILPVPGMWTLPGNQAVTQAGTYWVWARVYDSLNRMVGLVGPASIHVD